MENEYNQEKQFNFNKFWGNSDIASHVVFRRGTKMYCIYCGEVADTREHCPSRAFLEKPYPTDLPTLPACKKCNNSFSDDENYTKNMLNFLHMHYIEGKRLENNNAEQVREKKEAYDAAIKFIENPYFDDRMANVFRKLAIGHSAYEISTGYYSREWQGKPTYVSYVLKTMLNDEIWDELEYAELMDEDVFPELGSRAFRNIYVLQVPVVESESESRKTLNVCMLDWTDVQKGRYKYQVYIKQDKIRVKMIFKEFLYVEVVFEKEM